MAEKKTKKATFSAEERAAMRERARELKSAKNREEAEKDVLATIAGMPKPDRVLGERIHALVKASAPGFAPRTWYGMPAYAGPDGKVVCFFKAASKFGEHHATFGFNDVAKLESGAMWPVVFALTELTASDEKKLAALVKKAAR